VILVYWHHRATATLAYKRVSVVHCCVAQLQTVGSVNGVLFLESGGQPSLIPFACRKTLLFIVDWLTYQSWHRARYVTFVSISTAINFMVRKLFTTIDVLYTYSQRRSLSCFAQTWMLAALDARVPAPAPALAFHPDFLAGVRAWLHSRAGHRWSKHEPLPRLVLLQFSRAGMEAG